jgi:hypothetical protein
LFYCLAFLVSSFLGVLEIQKIRALNLFLSLGTKNGGGGAPEILRPSVRPVCLRELAKRTSQEFQNRYKLDLTRLGLSAYLKHVIVWVEKGLFVEKRFYVYLSQT